MKYRFIGYFELYHNTGIGHYNADLKTALEILDCDVAIHNCRTKIGVMLATLACIVNCFFLNHRIIFPDERFTILGFFCKNSFFIVHDLRRAYFIKYISKRNKIICISKSTCDAILENYAVKSEIWPNVFEPVKVVQRNIEAKKYDLLYIGSFEPRKKVAEIIEFADINGLQFCIMCSSFYWFRCNAELKKKIEASSNITVHLDLSESCKAELFCATKVYISNSEYEGFGRSVAEAILYGKIVYLRDTVENRSNFGQLVTFFDNVKVIDLNRFECNSSRPDQTQLKDFEEAHSFRRLKENIESTIL